MITDYKDALEYLYNSFPMFQRVGGEAYKPGLETITKLLDELGQPQKSLRCIHIAGTNGKGSTSNMLASVLFASKYKVGLFTSPHLIDFRERIRINGVKVEKSFVVDFCNKALEICGQLDLHPSFFELSTAMAFTYFALEKVDVAVIEVGMGGRLDSTNVISPLLSIITNVSLDHTAYLGKTIKAIAREKCGIIKEGVPVLIGDPNEDELIEQASIRSNDLHAPLIIANRSACVDEVEQLKDGTYQVQTTHYGSIHLPLRVDYQIQNLVTVLTALQVLDAYVPDLFLISSDAVRKGIGLTEQMGLQGRMQKIASSPDLYIDTGHNAAAWIAMEPFLKDLAEKKHLTVVMGMATDKDYRSVLHHLVPNAYYIFTQASVDRALPVQVLVKEAQNHGLDCSSQDSVKEAYRQAMARAEGDKEAAVLVAGSNFVVADLLSYLEENKE